MNAPLMNAQAVSDAGFSLTISREAEHVARCQRLRRQLDFAERGSDEVVRIATDHATDRYDDRANHALVTRAETGDPVGVVRLVLPARAAAGPDLPMEKIEPNPLGFAGEEIDFDTLAEAHFAVRRDYRNWRPDNPPNNDDWPQALDRRFSPVPVMLMRAIVVMSRQNGITALCAAMEPALVLNLARHGIKLKALGEPKEFHGLRQPCHAPLARIAEDMRQLRPDLHPMVFGD